MGPHQRFMLSRSNCYRTSVSWTRQIDDSGARRWPSGWTLFEETVAAVDAIPGVGRRTAEVIVAEMGTDMSRFPSAGHLASWAGVCPGNNRSAEKHKRAPTTKGNGWLKSALVEAAKVGRDGPRPIWVPSTSDSPGASGPTGRPWR